MTTASINRTCFSLPTCTDTHLPSPVRRRPRLTHVAYHCGMSLSWPALFPLHQVAIAPRRSLIVVTLVSRQVRLHLAFHFTFRHHLVSIKTFADRSLVMCRILFTSSSLVLC